MPPYYPIYLDLTGKRCVVIGGGEVAERKVQGLTESDANVTVISPEATEYIRRSSEAGSLAWAPREYREGDLTGAFLAIAATDRRSVNEAIAAEATKEKVVLNVVDDPPLCTFIAPSVVRRGVVTLAVSTGGASPALARKLRESLEDNEVLDYADLAGVLSSARKELKRRRVEVHPDRWQESIDRELVTLVRADGFERALEVLLERLLDGVAK
jgi:siroheme synthase-like protein